MEEWDGILNYRTVYHWIAMHSTPVLLLWDIYLVVDPSL